MSPLTELFRAAHDRAAARRQPDHAAGDVRRNDARRARTTHRGDDRVFLERAQSQPGLMAVGASAVVPPPGPERHPLALHDDDGSPGACQARRCCPRYDTKFGIQLWDGGTQAGRQVQLSPFGDRGDGDGGWGDKNAGGAYTIKALARRRNCQVVQSFRCRGHPLRAGRASISSRSTRAMATCSALS